MDKLKQACNNLKNQFDIEEPNIGHFNRFETKLKGKNNNNNFNIIYKYIAVAVAFILIFSFGVKTIQNYNKGIALADISPKLEETQYYFTSVIHEELEIIKKETTIENKKIVNDAMSQLNLLEDNYKKLTIELKNSENNKKIIFAMINNYQQRIVVLQNLLDNLENFKQLKYLQNENKSI